jgi:hypothetical protein
MILRFANLSLVLRANARANTPTPDRLMMRSENGSTQPDRPASERRVSFLRSHRIDADDSCKAAFRDCVRNGPF